MERQPDGSDRGFTLIELLIVIVILGVLAGVVVFAVGGISDRGTVSAASADERTIETAQETHMALYGTYTDEPGLVAAGLLRGESDMFDVTLAGNDYTLWPAGSAPTTVAPGPPTTLALVTTTTTPTAPTPTVYAGSYAGQSFGSGSKTLVIIGNGIGTTAVFSELQANPLADTVVIWLDSGDIATTTDVDVVMATSPDYVIAADAVPLNGGGAYVGSYMASKWAWPGTFWWSHQLGNPSSTQLESHL